MNTETGHPVAARRRLVALWLEAALLLLLAALTRWYVAPQFELLPENYLAETTYQCRLDTRTRPFSPLIITENLVQRRDQTLTTSGGHAIVEGDAHWFTTSGDPIFETLNSYGVDRASRENIPALGNVVRSGQYVYPPHTEPKRYGLWDPIYGGPCVASYQRMETFRGMRVYVLAYHCDGIDESAGYAALPDIPERYQAITYGKGQHWVEPLSGVIVNQVDGGVSYFVDAGSGKRVGNALNQWSMHYTEQTIGKQIAMAAGSRRRMLVVEIWLPVFCTLAGLLLIGLAMRASSGRLQ